MAVTERALVAKPDKLPVVTASLRRGRAQRQLISRLVVLDAVSAAAVIAVAASIQVGAPSWVAAALVVAPAWVICLAASSAYQPETLGAGSQEYRRVIRAGVGALCVTALLRDFDLFSSARGIPLRVFLTITLATMVTRWVARRFLQHARRRGSHLVSVLAIGSPSPVRELAVHLDRALYAGYRVDAACTDADGAVALPNGRRIPVVGRIDDAVACAQRAGAECVAVADRGAVGPDRMRRLAWALEGTGIDLVVAPEVTDFAGPRIQIQPVEGLPLLHLREPQLDGFHRVMKSALERSIAGVFLVMLSPLLALIALAVRRTSHGSAIYRQERVGRDGRCFTMFKFRTMVDNAEQMRLDLTDANEADGLLFKLRVDPRVTRLGQWLRRLSLDELPQFWNVLRGDMALVGPRPPLPDEFRRYDDSTRRRLLVRPGITGLWQVSGRSDLSWEDAVRLDLHYVENWSPVLDLLILGRTISAVLGGRGAY